MGTLASLVVRVGADISNFTTDMNRASTISRKNSAKIVTSMKRIGAGAVAGLAVAINEAVKFEKAMDEVSTLVGDTTDMDRMADSVRELSMQFGQSPIDQAKALYQVISAGASTAADQMDLLTASNKLAIGGVTSVAIAADALTTILNAYGMEAGQAADVSDLLFVGMKQGKTTVEEMGLSIGKVATIAAQTGVPLNQLIAAVATLTKSGIGTSEAMSGVQGVLSAVLKQSKKSTDAADDLGIAFNLQALEAKGLAVFLDEIQVAAGGDAEILQKLFGRVEGLTAVMSLGANGAKEFNAILKATGERAGATDEAFKKMSEGSAFQLGKLKVSVQILAEQLGSVLLPAVNIIAEALTIALAPVESMEDALNDAATAATTLGALLRSGGSVQEYTDAIDASNDSIIAMESQINNLKRQLELIEPTYHDGHDVVAALKDEIVDLEVQQRTLYRGMKEGQDVINDVNDLQEISVTATMRNIESTQTLIEYQDKLREKYSELLSEITPLASAGNAYADSIRSLNELLNASVISQDQFNDGMNDAATAFENAKFESMGLDTELEEIIVTAKRMPNVVQKTATKMGNSMAGVAAVIENSFKRLDDTFASFWSNLLKDGKFSLKGIKDLFLDTIAQMLHAALTQPIVLRIGAALTGGLASGAASASGGSIFGGGGLSGFVDSLGSLWGASGGAAGVGQNAAGAVGGFLGYRAQGGTGAGSQIGATIGAVGLGFVGGAIGGIIGGPLGAMVGKAVGAFVGGVLGGIVGGLFDKTPKLTLGGVDAGTGQKGGFVDTALGGVFFAKGTGVGKDVIGPAGEAIRDFDEAIASLLNENQLAKITEALSTWRIRLKDEALTIENILDSRFDVILGTFSQGIQDYVNSFDGVEDRTAALAKYVTALNTLGTTIATFAGTSATEAVQKLIDGAAQVSTGRLAEMSDSLLDLFATFDGTPEQLDQISQLIDARYRGEIEFLIAINDLIVSISQSIADQQASIQATLDGSAAPAQTQSFIDQWQAIRELFATISDAGSPEELASIVAQIQSMVGTAFGGLDVVGQARQGQMLIDFLGRVEADATARAEQLAQMVIDEGEILREQALLFADAISAPLDLNVAATDAVNDSVNRQTDLIREGQGMSQDQLDAILRAIREGNDLAGLRG